MIRILLIALLAYIAYRIFKNLRRSFGGQQSPNAPGRSLGDPQELVSCTACGTYVLKSNALKSNSDYYCSENCLNT